MSVSSVSPVGASSAGAASGASPVKNAGANAASTPKQAGSAGNNTPGAASWYGKSDGMSTSNFVSLSQQAKGTDTAMKDTKDMINMVLALQLMEKVMEAVGEILDKFVNDGSK